MSDVVDQYEDPERAAARERIEARHRPNGRDRQLEADYAECVEWGNGKPHRGVPHWIRQHHTTPFDTLGQRLTAVLMFDAQVNGRELSKAHAAADASRCIRELLGEEATPTTPKLYPTYGLTQALTLPPVQWRIDGYLPTGKAQFGIIGAAAAGKGLVGPIDMGLSVARAGHSYRHSLPVRHGGVAYVVAEGWAGVPQRMRSWLDYYEVSEEERAAIPFTCIPAAPQLPNRDDTRRLIDTIGAIGGVDLVFIDTLSRTLPGSDSDAAEMNPYVAAMGTIADELNVDVGVVHHTGWNTERERGSTVLRAALDTLWLVTRDDTRIEVSCLKSKDAPEFAPFAFDVRPHGTSAVVVPISEGDKRQRPTTLPTTRQKALDALRTVDEGGGATFTKWHETTSLPKATFNRAKDDLVSWGLIEKRAGKWVTL